MKKKDFVLVVLNKNFFESTIQKLNFGKINLVAIFMDGGEKLFQVNDNQIPIIPFSVFYSKVKHYRNFVWLIDGSSNVASDFEKVKKFLKTFNINENNIINLENVSKISPALFANVNYAEKHGVDFFATGNEFICSGLNLRFIPCVHKNAGDALGGAILADTDQDLQQGYSLAKNIFENVQPGKIKFVLIGLSLDSFHIDNSNNFSNFKNLFALSNASSEQVDLNFSNVKKNFNREFSADAIINWEDNEKILSSDATEKNIQVLKDYIKLCQANNAKAVGVIFPFAPAARKNYDKELLKNFREIIHDLEKNGNFICVDMAELNLDYDCFCDMTHLNSRGTMSVNALLSLKLYMNGLIPLESFCKVNYEYLNRLSWISDKDDYNSLVEKIFAVSAKKIARKDKIKVGFVTIDSAQWCGDDLYNLFANNERFETTILDCLRTDKASNPLVIKDFWRGVEQFKERNLNVIALDNRYSQVPVQDVLIFLTPYFGYCVKALRPERISAETLMAHIPYSFSISVRDRPFYNKIMFNTAWKIFLSSKIGLDVYATNRLGLPRGIFSGYPRMDIFFRRRKDVKELSDFHFNWKMARPNSKKIIYAPHWSINAITRYATFQWNYQFMYEFAKNHPEISWVVKPHQALFFSTVKEKVFPSAEAYEEYLQKWNDLPNAQVYTGAYYQGLFATSDGMIHDSGSFIAEYQFVNKPMIFLTREGEKFNALGEEILKASYLVDGKDLEKIAATMQDVFVNGNDYKAPERREVFEKYLNYPKYNKMLASNFIYSSIADELKEEKNC